jgi:hypothetical protein
MAKLAPTSPHIVASTPPSVNPLPATPVGHHQVTVNQQQSVPSYIQRNGMTPQQHFALSLAKVNAIKEMCISANMTTILVDSFFPPLSGRRLLVISLEQRDALATAPQNLQRDCRHLMTPS